MVGRSPLDQSTGVPTRSVTVLIADDLEAWRLQVRRLLGHRREWQIAGEACDGREAIQKAEELRPDVVLMDISMPGMNGIEAARFIQQLSPTSSIIFLTQHADDDIRTAALTAGVQGYVLKANAARELVSTIAETVCSSVVREQARAIT